jgi:arsenate reductase-like glutaredoxin family protein
MNEFFIYWKNNCQWCENAKRLIEAHGDRWTGLNIEDHPENLEEFLRLLMLLVVQWSKLVHTTI